MARVTSAVMVSALVRRVNQEGGSAAVLAKGDPSAGAILLLTYEKGRNPRFFERGIGPDGNGALIVAGPASIVDEGEVTDYWRRRRRSDSDLWVIELDIAGAERFAAETMGIDFKVTRREGAGLCNCVVPFACEASGYAVGGYARRPV
jgi:hypothetical protein